MNRKVLKAKVIESLLIQGFHVNGHVVPATHDKMSLKNIHNHSRREQLVENKEFLLKNIKLVRKYVPNPKEIRIEDIDLELREVQEHSVEHVLYRWWNLAWWSMPFQRAYGRQMRFLLWDKYHNCPFGIIGLQSPILKMAVRDKYLQVPSQDLDLIINQSMQAQRLGALPPFNNVIGGKLVSLVLTSNEIRERYANKYKGAITLLKRRTIEPDLLFISTTSAYGKSSIYNRLKYRNDAVAVSLGYTKGSGTFHITNEIYSDIQKLLHRNHIDTNTTFGYGASRKMKLIDQALHLLGLDSFHYHNIKREYFLFPVVKNLTEVIAHKALPVHFDRPISDLTEFWKERWANKRAATDNTYQKFDFDEFSKNLFHEINLFERL